LTRRHRSQQPDDSSVPPPDQGRVRAGNPLMRHRAVIGVGAAFVVAAIGGGLVYFGWRTDDAVTPPPQAAGGLSAGVGPAPVFETAGHDSPDGTLLHGEFVVADHGGYQTRLTQTGTVVSASASAFTLSSADGFTRRYAVGPGTVIRNGEGAGAAAAAIAVGESATVQAEEAGGAVTATAVLHGSPLDLRSGVARRAASGMPVR
jgi:hypothetical protein